SQAQSRALERVSRSTQELSAIRDQLQAHSEELDRYARLLEVSSLVSRETVAILEREEMLDRAVQLIAQQLHFDQAAIYTVDRSEDEISLAAAAQPGHELTDLSTIRQVIRTGSQRGRQSPLDGRVHHELTLPLQVSGQVIGALDVHATRPVAFSEQEILALQGMADLLALAMENARLLTETRASLKELDALYRHYTAEAWQQFLGTRGETWHYQSGPEAVPNQAWEPLFAEAKQSGQPVTGESGQDGDRYYLLALPVRLRQIPIGVVGFYRPAGAGPWQPADIAAIEAVTSRLALSVENLRLLEEAQRRAAREQMLSQMTDRFVRSLDMDTLLQTAVRELGQVLSVDEIAVHVSPPDSSPPTQGREED
ncbi:MAG TPA: GAF domain-containing protein, partial [Anaerolineae bacterium]|nr:GAF domain-containing protein [Anaerolineae bacterium]